MPLTVIDLKALVNTLEFNSVESLRAAHREWVGESLLGGVQRREEVWLQSVAVGSAEFAQRTQAALGVRGRKRNIAENDAGCVLRETEESYGSVFGVKNEPIAPKNALLWCSFRVKTGCLLGLTPVSPI